VQKDYFPRIMGMLFMLMPFSLSLFMVFIIFFISLELLQELIDFLHGVPLPSAMRLRRAAADQQWIGALFLVHGLDHRLDALEGIVRNFRASFNTLPTPGIIPRRSFMLPIFLMVAQLLQEVVKVELILAHFGLQTQAFLFVKLLLRTFPRGDHVAHAQDPGGHTVGVEAVEGIHFFARSTRT
jgi:hypothetical protein